MSPQHEQRPLSLQGKTAIVTGASRGIGAVIALDLASRGADVCLTYVSDKSGEAVTKLAARIRSLPHRPVAQVCQADLSTLDGPQRVVDKFLKSDGSKERPLHILVNNAGVERVKSLAECTVEDYDAVYNLNVRGVILMTQAVLPYLQPAGRIINISSVGARAGFANLSLYCSSKAALEGLTRCWAAELGHNGTTVNAINVGPVQSDMLNNIPKEIVQRQKETTPVENRLGTAEEVARLVAWLAGDESGWISGQAISASGGWAMY
ncbi:hypothetical protein VTK73DRAFT_362 [Phialemonium thermophilum]|uniref:Ketoreductase domain-containing protein n=1 Tax=Phialemonium thermophilum TaxID=223376 RepID=A0ABR3XEL8_9PEZI